MREENLDLLVDQIIELGFPKTGLREYLDGFNGEDQFHYYHKRRIDQNQISYSLLVTKDQADGLYKPQGYDAVLLQTHPILHDRFGNIDTGILEQQMRETDWNKPLEEIFADEHSENLYTEVLDLASCADVEAQDIAQRLMFRYWLYSPMSVILDLDYLNNYIRKFHFTLTGDHLADVKATEAFHLLSGRGVIKFSAETDKPVQSATHWKVIENGELLSLPEYDLMPLLRRLPIREMANDKKGATLLHQIISGEQASIYLQKNNLLIPALIEADPRGQTLILRDRKGPRLNIDDWLLKQPVKILPQKKSPTNKKSEKNSKSKRNGRSL